MHPNHPETTPCPPQSVGKLSSMKPVPGAKKLEDRCPVSLSSQDSVQLSSVAQLCPTRCDPIDCSTRASLSITNSQSLLKLMSVESVMPSSHFILCGPLLLPPSIFPSIRVSSNESALRIRWPKYWSFSFSISPSNEGCCQDGIWKFRPLGVRSAPRKPRAGAHACSVASRSL